MPKPYDPMYCLFCGGRINKRKTAGIPDYYKRKFCSLSCQHKWNTKTKTKYVECDFCGVLFSKKISAINEHNYCCNDCRSKHWSSIGSNKVLCSWCGDKFKKALCQINITQNHFCSRKCMGDWQSEFARGELSYNWQGGITTVNQRIRALRQYGDWVQSVFKRDGYRCVSCDDNTGGNLQAHHIEPLSSIIKDHNICENTAVKCGAVWDIKNGKTLCEDCHRREHRGNNSRTV